MLSKLKAGNKIVGLKQVKRALNAHEVDIVYLANDADSKLINLIIDLCEEKEVEVVQVENMKELGNACGIDVSAATAALLK